MSESPVTIKAISKTGKFAEGAYFVHSKKYFTNAAQFIYASNCLQDRVKTCSSVVWYFQGMALELLSKGLLYSHDRKKYTPQVLAQKPFSHDLCKIVDELVRQSLLTITDRQKNALKRLNDFYFENGNHELRYPSLLSVFTEIRPEKKHESPIVEILNKLVKKADAKAGFTKNNN